MTVIHIPSSDIPTDRSAIDIDSFTATVSRLEVPHRGPRGWHHHGDHHVIAYLISGKVRIQSGAGGSIITEPSPGDLVHIEPGTVHQETYEGEIATVGFTVGSGPGRVDVAGPEGSQALASEISGDINERSRMPTCLPLVGDGVKLALMTETPTLHLTVGLPGVGKTTLARKIAHEDKAVRFSPDEWMIPLFGTTWREPDAVGKRGALEGRLLWAAHEVLGVGGSVVLDFGCWAEAERWAIRAVAEHAGGRFRLNFIDLPEAERRARATGRWEGDPGSTFEMSPGDHDRFLGLFQAPTEEEIAAEHLPAPPTGYRSWLAWAAHRWPSLPDFADEQEQARSLL